jgi:hypothetical protein
MKIGAKYLAKGENDHPPLGNFINWHITNLHLKKRKIADDLDIHPNSLNQYFKQQSLQFGILWRLSQVMNLNLIMILGEKLKIDFETKVEKNLRAELAEKEEVIKSLELELGVYRKIVERRN